ncbi:RPA-related protein RADX isoform X2 [Carettochelys insculpta]|uniref:RPA-related protein RADX isoform X2 n=1 Tax=Carettochelys insculpta TaxID=44489 RepID=UPI003EBB2F4B
MEEAEEAAAAAAAPLGSSGGAGPSATSWLQRLCSEVFRSSQRSVPVAEAPPLAVVAVERYAAESPPPRSALPKPPAPAYCYDVTLADGSRREKCCLAPALNGLVQRNALRAGCRVRLARCSYLYDEKKLSSGFLCLEALEVLRGPADLGREPDQPRRRPLRGGRSHYLPLWNSEDPYGDIWLASRPPQRVEIDVSRLTSLGQLEMNWRSGINVSPLLVRILHKSRLRYYGKPDKKLDVPYQAYFEVADSSGMMSMVLWNSLCPEWYKSMKINTVLLLEQYGVKTSFPFKTQPTPRDSQMKRFTTIEISLNIRDPPTKINIIPEKMVKPEWRLPEVRYQFVTRSELDNLPNNHSCDIIGLVTFVGRAERTRKKEYGEDFWLYRWAHAVDGTSDQPFILELFTTSQPDVFELIHPMTYLVCTQMRVVRDITENTPRTLYLTTSNESQMFITGWHKGQPYTRDSKVKSFIQWIKTQSEADQIKKTVIGGYYPFPPAPNTFLKYCKNNKVESVLKAISETKRETEDLHYREHKRIAVQGIISAIRYVSYAAEDTSGVDPIQKDKVQSTSQTTVKSTGVTKDCVTKGKKQSHRNKEAKSLFDSQRGSLEQQQHPKKSRIKRKIEHRTEAEKKRDMSVFMSACPYFTRSASKKLNLHEFQQENSVPEQNLLAAPDASQPSRADKEGVNDRPDIEEMGRTCHDSWQSDLWTKVKDNLVDHLHYGTVFPESIPRKFDYMHKEFLIQQYNLHPSVKKPKEYITNKEIHEFKSASGLGHYEVTILGINHDVAIDVAFLPIFCPGDPYLFHAEDIQNDTLLSCMNCISLCQQETASNEKFYDTCPLSNETVKAAVDLDRQHVICILDICRLSEDKVEVFLNKIYKIMETDVVNLV